MPAAQADRNLLFGVLALQMDFAGRDALVAAMNAWVLDKDKPLGQILVEQQALRPDQHAALEALVHLHLERHGGDAARSLAALHVPAPVADDLRSLTDHDLQASLARLPTRSADGAAALPATAAEVKAAGGVRYHVLRPHGKGGLGEVFVALDEELHREVALKEIRPDHAADPHSRGRFVREAEITGGLEHPGIVPVYGLGAHADGRPFYAMRFIQGETLGAAVARYHRAGGGKEPGRSREFELRGLLSRFVAVCNALAYAHSRGVIHRDLKPGNVMFGKYGETLVVDWGLAKAGVRPEAGPDASGNGEGLPEPTLTPLLADGIETQAGSALGTPAYMSPEQASGRLDLLGPAGDIYSLGATLYTLLTGRPPIEGKDSGEILRKAQQGEWLPPRQVKADVPAALDAVCRKAMALRPADRYATALELAGEIERWLADEPVAAYAEPWRVRSRRWLRRHRTLVSTAVGALVVALLGATVGLVVVSDARDNEATARKTAEEQKDEADRRREEARFNQYVAQMNLVQRQYEANNIGHVRELLEALIPREAALKDYRGFEWYYWQRMTHRELLTLEGHLGDVHDVAFSPDGRRLATGGEDHTVRVWDAATGREVWTLRGHDARVLHVAFSPDGRHLATAAQDNTVRVWDATAGRELFALKGHKEGCERVVFSPDGRRLASTGADSTARVWDVLSGKPLFSIKGPSGVVWGVRFSPDGGRLASWGGKQSAVWVSDATTGQPLFTFKGSAGMVWGVAFSPDGRRLVSWGDESVVRVSDGATGRTLLKLEGHTGSVHDVLFRPDGQQLASAGADSTVRVWEAARGKALMTLKGHSSTVTCLAFSPDGRRLASAGEDSTVRVWDGSTGSELITLKGHTDRVSRVAFRPDGRRLASAGDSTARVWDAAGGELFTLGGDTAWVTRMAFSPDGRRLASVGLDLPVRVWDALTGEALLTLNGHTASPFCVVYSPDGHRLASAGGDAMVRVWDGNTGWKLSALHG